MWRQNSIVLTQLFCFVPRHDFRYFYFLGSGITQSVFCDGLSYLFQQKIFRMTNCIPTLNFQKQNPKPWSLDFVKPEFRMFVCGRQEGRKATKNRKIPTYRVQSFGHNSETYRDIKNWYSSLTSTIHSEDNDIWMSLNVFDINLHRFADLSNIFYFWDVNIYDSSPIWTYWPTLVLGGFWFATTSSIFPEIIFKIGLVVFPRNEKAGLFFMNGVHAMRCVPRQCREIV